MHELCESGKALLTMTGEVKLFHYTSGEWIGTLAGEKPMDWNDPVDHSLHQRLLSHRLLSAGVSPDRAFQI